MDNKKRSWKRIIPAEKKFHLIPLKEIYNFSTIEVLKDQPEPKKLWENKQEFFYWLWWLWER